MAMDWEVVETQVITTTDMGQHHLLVINPNHQTIAGDTIGENVSLGVPAGMNTAACIATSLDMDSLIVVRQWQIMKKRTVTKKR